METAALTVKNYYESHQVLPASVTINSQIITMPEFLQLLVTGAININNNNLNSITVSTVNNPTNPTGTYKSGSLSESSYLAYALSIKNYITANTRAPNYATTSLGSIPFTKLVYMYSNIINYYAVSKKLPSTCSI